MAVRILLVLALASVMGLLGCRPRGESVQTSMVTESAESEASPEDARQAANGVEEEAAPGKADVVGQTGGQGPPTTTPVSNDQAPEPPHSTRRKQRSSKSQPGTLVIEMTVHRGPAAYDRPPGPWLYIDGRLIRDYTDREWSFSQLNVSESLSLLPGDYFVEMVAAGTHYADSGDNPTQTPFVLNVDARHVKVEADQTAQIKHACREMLVAHRKNPYSGQPLAFPPRECIGWARHWQGIAQQQMTLYERDPLVIALKQLDTTLGNRTPETPVVMLDIPEVYGGRREINANQIRLIVDWIDGSYWGEWPSNFTYVLDLDYVGDVKEEFRHVELCDKLVKQHRDQIQQLKSVARKLDQSRE